MPVKTTIASKYDLLGNYTINGYEYNLSTYLKLWIDFAESPSDRSQFSADIDTIEYEGSVTSEVQTIGIIQHNVARFDDSEDLNALITYNSTTNPTSFGDGSSDNPFSVSFWYYRDSTYASATNETFFEKGDDTSAKSEYRGKISSSGYIEFQLTDASSGGIETCSAYHPDCASSSDITDLNDEWDHYVFTYDGSTGRNGMNIYVNGSLLSSPARSGAGSYTSLEAVSDKFFIGADKDGIAEADGYMSEFSVFSKELSPNEVQSIYLGTKDKVSLTVIKSGRINNPARTIIKDLDNRTGTYPTVHRMNKKDTAGILSNVLFSDDKVIKFGTRIKDDFKIKNIDLFSMPVNSNKWTVTTGVEVRREVDPKGNNLITKSLLQLSGEGDSDGRWIRTAKKVTNPTVYLKILRGPFNDTADSLVKLSKGGSTETLKIQASTAGSSWTTIAIETPYISSTANENLIINDGLDAQYPFFGEADQNNIGIISNNKRPKLSLKIPAEAFANAGFYDPFYIRIIQENIADDTKTIWAIDSIDIISREDQVSYPQLSILGDVAHNFYLTQSIATPNYLGSLTTTGSAIEGITDSYTRTLNNNEQQLSPFNEESVIDYQNNIFFNEGTNKDVIPGFGVGLLSKTKFEIDLSPSSETEIGFTKLFTDGVDDESGDGVLLMVYWNNHLKKWQKIGKPLGIGMNNKLAVAAQNIDIIKTYLTSSAIGFGPNLAAFGSASDGSNSSNGLNVFSKDALSTIRKPTDVFAFPYGPQYHATSSQTIKAKEIGVTKPFVLEKISLKFDIKLESPDNADPSYQSTFNEAYLKTNDGLSSVGTISGLSNVMPTFFIMKQQKDNFNIFKNIEYRAGGITSDQYSFEIPGNFSIVSGSNNTTFVDTSRSLVTYSQSLFSIARAPFPGSVNNDFIVSDLPLLGYPSDKHIIIDTGLGTGSPVSYTGSIGVNSFVKNCTVYPKIGRLDVKGVTLGSNGQHRLMIEKSTNDRSRSLSDVRGIVNGYSSFAKGEIYFQPGAGASNPLESVVSARSDEIEKVSPYVIFPEDDLILGWQYPLPKNTIVSFPDNASISGRHKMTLFGNSKLTLFGSQVKDGKEFHEGLNQNLTSNAVHEVVGNEPVIDQWQIATRNEMTGSFSDQFMYALQTAPAGSTGFSTGYVIGRLLPPPPDNNTSKLYQTYWQNGSDPVKRINSRWAANFGNSTSLLSSTPLVNVIKAFDTITGPFKPAAGYLQQIQAFLNLADYKRIVFDSSRLNTTSITGINYGSSQNYTHQFGIEDRIIKLGGSPKYYFNTKHYGFYSDNIRQGLDTRFKIKKGDTFDNNVFEQAVKVQFVESEYDNEDLRFRIFKPIRPDEITGTAYEEFQSSNISLFSTSSIPFFDDNVVRNRTYVDDRLTVS